MTDITPKLTTTTAANTAATQTAKPADTAATANTTATQTANTAATATTAAPAGDKNDVKATTATTQAAPQDNIDEAEQRALDIIQEAFKKDGAISEGEQKIIDDVKAKFAESPKAGATTTTEAKDPAGGAGSTTTTGTTTTAPTTTTGSTSESGSTTGSGSSSDSSSPTESTSPASSPTWAVGDKAVQGKTFSSVGDPHETSGDGAKFDNMEEGTFIKARSASGDFELQTTQGKDKSGRWPNATVNHAAAVKSGKDVVTYDGLSKTLTVNGQPKTLKEGESLDLPDGGKVTGNKNGVTITTKAGDKVEVIQRDNYIDVKGEIGPNRKDGEIRGSLGNFDADTDKANELMGRTGDKPVGAPNDPAALKKFIDEWRAKPGESLFKEAPGGGGANGPDAVTADFEKEFAQRDANKDGKLEGNEIPADFKAANPNKTSATKEEVMAFRKQAEEAAVNADKEAFKKLDLNQDFNLDGKELTEELKKMDRDNDGVVSDMEFIAAKSEARRQDRWKDLGGAPADKPGLDPGKQTADVEAEFKARDITGNGALTGTEIPEDYKKAFPNATKVTLDEYKAFRAKHETDAQAADKADFAKRDLNKDGTLDGKELEGLNLNGITELSEAKFLEDQAKKRAEARAAELAEYLKQIASLQAAAAPAAPAAPADTAPADTAPAATAPAATAPAATAPAAQA
ncbi:MAG: hypothetical protein VKP62_09725 [Candidatus Sericytochromatia bacterium]|nr:hypothetical protein [Candidatus Sericytochromatia bacterium]